VEPDGQISVRLQNLAYGKEPLQFPHQQERQVDQLKELRENLDKTHPVA
jgi:hypothetical protein